MGSRRVRTGPALAASLLALATGCASYSHERDVWIEVESEHFLLYSNAGEEEAVDIVKGIELMRALFRRVTTAQRFEPRIPTLVHLFGDSRSAAFFGLGHGGALGYFSGHLDGNYIALYTGFNPFEVLGHEYLHFLVRNQDSDYRYPHWYDEGFAEVASHVRIAEGWLEFGVAPSMRLRRLQEAKSLLPLETLMTTRYYRDLEEKRHLFYPQAWLLTHYFYFGKRAGFPDRSEQVVRYLDLLNDGVEEAEACTQAFGTGFEELDQELAAYLERAEFRPMPVPLAALEPGRVLGVRTLSTGEALTRLGELRLYAWDDEHEGSEWMLRYTRELYNKALAREPDNVRAQVGRAWLEPEAGNAERRFARALELAPDDPWVHASLGRWLDRQVERAGTKWPEQRRGEALARARRHFARSAKLAPELPIAFWGLGATYRFEGQDPEKGVRFVQHARRLLPASLEASLTLGELFYRMGELDRARAELERVRRWSHGGPELERAEQLLGWIDLRAAPPEEPG